MRRRDRALRLARLRRAGRVLVGSVVLCAAVAGLPACGGERDAGKPTGRDGTAAPSGQAAPAEQTLQFRIDGMHCEGCAQTIQSALARLPGVTAASVVFAESLATVTGRLSEASGAEIVSAVERLGYRAMPCLADPATPR